MLTVSSRPPTASGPSILYTFREIVFGEDRTHTKITLSTKIQDVVFRVHCLKLYPSHMKVAWGFIGPGGGDPYGTVRILCKSGVRIKILESGSGNLDPHQFALFLVQFADPELRAFRVLMDFWRVRIRRSRYGFASHLGSFRKFLAKVFW